MERLIAIVIGIFILVIFIIIKILTSSRRQRKLNEIAHKVLAEFDFNKEKEEIKSIGARYVSEQYSCPRCNGMLVMRKGIYGTFWGCNHYPECKYTGRLNRGLLRRKAERTYRTIKAS